MLIVFTGLPGAGKSTLAKKLTRHLGAVYLRVDTIEQSLTNSILNLRDLEDVGYRVGYVLAEENLRLGQKVIADSVNPIALTRNAWRNVAERVGRRVIEVEVICSDITEHQIRIEERRSDVPGLKLLTWREVVDREYEPMTGDHIAIDSAGKSPEQSFESLLNLLSLSENEA